jgi:hypothetical protein
MKIKALAVLASSLVAGSAQAALIAAWDFSQYSPGNLSFDGGDTYVNTLSSNYSDLDETLIPGIGIGSTQWGTLHLDGQYGSFATPADGSDPFRPTSGNIDLNTNVAPVFGGTVGGAAAGNALLNEDAVPSQTLFNPNSMVARTKPGGGLLDVVFAVNLGAQYLADALGVSFAGITTGAAGSSVQVEFSTDGNAYASVGSAALTTTGQVFSFALGGDDLTQGFVRLRFTGSNTILPRIDNVAISGAVTLIPEPGTALLLVTGLAGLAAIGRRRA